MKIYNDLTKIYKRIFWTKTIGLSLSLVGVLMLMTNFNYQEYKMFFWAMMFWYPMVGGMVGIMGILDYHPTLKINLYLWRGAMMGAFMNLLLVLLAYDSLVSIANAYQINISAGSLIAATILEGALVGLFMDYVTTKMFGEGAELLER